MMTSAHVVETSVNVTNSPSRDYSRPDDQTTQTPETVGFKPFTILLKLEEWKAFVDSTRAKGAYFKDKFLFHVLAAFSMTYMNTKATNCPVFLTMLREVVMSHIGHPICGQLAKMHVKWSVIVTVRLGLEILFALDMKRKLSHIARAHIWMCQVDDWIWLYCWLGSC